jgi:ribosomal protein L33
MVDQTLINESKERIVDDIIIIGMNEVKGYTTKRNLKNHFNKLRISQYGGV